MDNFKIIMIGVILSLVLVWALVKLVSDISTPVMPKYEDTPISSRIKLKEYKRLPNGRGIFIIQVDGKEYLAGHDIYITPIEE